MIMKINVIQGGMIAMMAIQIVFSEQDHVPTILGEIENVANSATNLFTNAVEKPRNFIINATRITTGYIDSAASKGMEFPIRRVLEKFRNRMPYGIPELGIPPLDPFELDEVDIVIENPEIGNVSITIQDLQLHNLSTFIINKAKLSLIGPTIAANITVPRIYVEGFYNISGDLSQKFQLHGYGPFKGNIHDFQLYINTILGYSRGVYLKTFDLDFTLKFIDINLKNLMDDQELNDIMNKVVQELTPKVLDIIKPDILPDIENYLSAKINETIHHLTMKDIINVLMGYNEIREFTYLPVS
ncbi:uncharacterized protein LOC551572 isoform X3 [Apis mellifera]|uniref:Uncharacterized protein LOC551572 isoform X3 n=2 Tax=Apis mellifera TaxID=7460 RepID=A0A7M7M0V3_APIME|nr:uncharacterized protein LOC551572 isoform X3 [Apis mellifera]|eukprot:XP_016769295.1 uncharacterized protein LOC551572 isoform X3 [Apis mellifera]